MPETTLSTPPYLTIKRTSDDGKRNFDFANLHKRLFGREADTTNGDCIHCNLYSSTHETSTAASGQIQNYLKCLRIYLTLSQLAIFIHSISLHTICRIQYLTSNVIYLSTASYLHHKSVNIQNFNSIFNPFLTQILTLSYETSLNRK